MSPPVVAVEVARPEQRISAHPSRNPVLRIAVLMLLAYLLLAACVLQYHHGDLRGFSLIGQQFITQSDRSPVIQAEPQIDLGRNGVGYDGQFVYYIALDPINARYYIDNPPYRYTRILLPLLARLLALGQPAAIPWTIVLVNLFAAIGGTMALAGWCQKRGLSPWWALVYGLSLGQMMAFARNLTDVLAYALVAGAVYSFDCSPRQHWRAALLFGLAGLARETTLLFAVLYTLRLLIDAWSARPRRFGTVATFAVLALGPVLLWQAALYWWMGSIGLLGGPGLAVAPLAGFIPLYPFAGSVVITIVVMLIPALFCLVGALHALWIDPATRRRVEVWTLLLNILLFALLLPTPALVDLYSAARIGLGGVLAAVFASAYIKWRGWFYGAVTCWMLAAFGYFALLNGLAPLTIWP